ncbi:MAG: helix-turn-helix domain-containing protein [Mycobacterium sp.]|nr:helix-turn-helix domain-containing protein [Mycobacterium sp.]
MTTALTVAEAAAQLGRTEEAVRSAIRSGRLAADRPGHAYAISKAQLDAYRAAYLADPAAARAAARHDRIRLRMLAMLSGEPLTRGQLRARMPGYNRDRGFTTALTSLIDEGAVVDHGRGKPLARAA